IWARLAKTIGRPDLVDDPCCADGASRAASAEFIQPLVENWMADKTRAEVVDALNAAGVPTGPVYTVTDVFEDDYFRRRHMLVDVDDPQVGPLTFARTAPHLSTAPEIPTNPAPNLGQHTRPILQELLDYDPDQVDRLIEAGVVAAAD
ncbi:MAG TPA: CoA transferase, partial [Anaerolineae bacterium]